MSTQTEPSDATRDTHGKIIRLPSANWLLFLPSLALAVLLIGLIGGAWMVNWYEGNVAKDELLREVQWVENAVARRMQADQQFVDRIAGAIGEASQIPPHIVKEAEEFLSNSPAVIAIAWNNPEGEILWLRPVGRPIAQIIAERPGVSEKTRVSRLVSATGRSTYTQPYADDAGNNYVQYHSPVQSGDKFLGTISVTYPLGAMMRYLIPESFSSKYHIELVDTEQNPLFSPRPARSVDPVLSQSVTLSLPWRDLKLKASSYRTSTPWLRNLLLIALLGLMAVLIWALVSLQRHIRRRLESDQALQTSYERFLTVLDSMDVAVWVADLQTDRLLFMNESCRKRFPGGRLGLPVARLERVFSAPPTVNYPRAKLLNDKGEPVEAFKDEIEESHTGRWYLMRAKAIRWVDGTLVRLHMAGDITDRKIAEQKSQLQQQKLMQTARLLTMGEMASTLAHEINQPLAAIANYNKGCVRRLKSGQWNEVELIVAMEKAAHQAERAGAVVHRVREFVRDREPNRLPFSINELLLEAVKLTEIDSERADVEMQLSLDVQNPEVLGDRVMIEQVVLNLVKNGIEAMHEIPIEMRRLTLRTRLTDNAVEVAIIDTGKGVSDEAAAELFSPFFTTKIHGMGIGLNICRSIVEMHEGRLWFENNKGTVGASFLFTLPTQSERSKLSGVDTIGPSVLIQSDSKKYDAFK